MTQSKSLLVVIDPTGTEGHLLQEAAAHAAGTGSDLVALAVMTTADYRGAPKPAPGSLINGPTAPILFHRVKRRDP